MPTQKFYAHCPLFYGLKGTVFDLEDEDQRIAYLTNLCETWTSLPYPVMQEYFKHHELEYDWDEYKKVLYPERIKATGDLIYENTEIDIEMNFIREENFTILRGKHAYEQTKLYMEAWINPEELTAYIQQDWSAFENFLGQKKAKCTEKWLNPKLWDSPRVVETLLEYLAVHEAKNPGDYIASQVLENVNPEEYITTPEDFTNYIEDIGAFDFRTEYDRLMLQGNRYLEIMKRQHPRKWTKYVKPVTDGKERVVRELAEELAEKIAEYAS